MLTFRAVPVPEGEPGRALLQHLGQAARLPGAPLEVQVAGHLGVVLELWAEGPGHHARAAAVPVGQEGELGRHVAVGSHVGEVPEPLVLLRQRPVSVGGGDGYTMQRLGLLCYDI